MSVNQPMSSSHMGDFQHPMHVGYPMSVANQTAPQPSPIPQIGTPHQPPPQYVHPGTPVFHQGGNDPFQGVMSPMQQPGMSGPTVRIKAKIYILVFKR